MHVYDLMENSTAANAKDVKLTIVDSLKNNDFHFTIEDNGKGMSPEFLAKVTDPYTTSRTTRKVGLGLPLIKMNTEKCGGGMKLTSEVGVGTRLEFWFEHNNWDRPPMGDLPGTLVMLLSAHEAIVSWRKTVPLSGGMTTLHFVVSRSPSGVGLMKRYS